MKNRGKQSALLVTAWVCMMITLMVVVEGKPGGHYKPQFRRAPPSSDQMSNKGLRDFEPVSYWTPEIAQFYSFPTASNVPNVAILELCDEDAPCGYFQSDLDTFWDAIAANWTSLGYPSTEQRPTVTPVLVYDHLSGKWGNNTPGLSEADVEIVLDIEIVTGLFPDFGVTATVYFTPNSKQGIYNGLRRAIESGLHNAISLSWAGPEWFDLPVAGCFVDVSAAQDLSEPLDCPTALEQLLVAGAKRGVSLFTSSGDNASEDPQLNLPLTVLSPASVPHAISVGGTSILRTSSSSYAYSTLVETTWNDFCGACPVALNPCDPTNLTDAYVICGTGGGYSTVYVPPSYQEDAVSGYQLPGGLLGDASSAPTLASFSTRGVPDVAALADPATGIIIYGTFVASDCSGSEPELQPPAWFPVGGTSAAAPIWAALWSLASGNKPWYFAGTVLYGHTSAFHDITEGDNWSNNGWGYIGYNATGGYDLVTGLGSPNGEALAQVIQGIKKSGKNPGVGDTSSPAAATLSLSFGLLSFLMLIFI